MNYDKMYYTGKIATVTGGASGIGLALCEELLESGAAGVVLVDFNQKALNEHASRLATQYPSRVKGIFCDVTMEKEVKSMVDGATEFGGGRLDLLINCAGLGLMAKFTEEPEGLDPNNLFMSRLATNDAWEKAFAVNFYGPVYGCLAAIPHMLRQGGGQIVNIISGIAFSPMAYQSMYASTKSALNILSLALRAELKSYNIKINSATPGTTATPIFVGLGKAAPPEAQSPHQSAQRILNGVASNERLILGDDGDVDGAKHCFLPDAMGSVQDRVYLNFARQRRSGKLSFVNKNIQDPSLPEDEKAAKQQAFLSRISETDPMDYDKISEKLTGYIAEREADHIEDGYYQGKTALVTGGGSGVGLALCRQLLDSGAKKIVVADISTENLRRQCDSLKEVYPGKVKGILCDVAREQEVISMISAATKFFGEHFDFLFNCAGIGQRGMTVEVSDSAEITRRTGMIVETQQQWSQVFAVNFFGPLYVCRAALPVMLKQGSGQIVNIISGQAFAPLPYEAIYSAAKAALNALTLVLRYEYWETGVRFNSATPGTTDTPIFKGNAPDSAQSPQQSARRILAGVCKNERLILGDDDDVRGAILCFNPGARDIWEQYYERVVANRRGLC